MAANQRILFVDDELAIRTAFSRFMRARGFDVDVAGGFKEALDVAQQQTYSVVLSDLRMPDGDGLELIDKLRELHPESTYLLVTGSMEPVDSENSKHGVEIIAKPWDPQRLTETLRRAVAQAQRTTRRAKPEHCVLLVTDDAAREENLCSHLRPGAGLDVVSVRSRREAETFLHQDFQVVMVDVSHSPPNDMGYNEFIHCVQEQSPHSAIVVLGSTADEACVMDALCHGAQDFVLLEDIETPPLLRVVLHAIDSKRMDERSQYLESLQALHGSVPSVLGEAESRRHFLTDLAMALREQQFFLQYQPKVCFPTGRVEGCEALLRWRHPTKGIISPGVFIPALESTGGIVKVGIWVLDEVCRQLRAWLDAGYAPTRMALNVSARQLEQENFPKLVADALARHAVAPELLELEITESLLMENLQSHLHQLEALRQMGVRLALDDFGTGFSSLSYLTRLPIHTLKLDRSFVRDLQESEKTTAIARAIIDLGHALGLQVVAEGVETEPQRLRLKHMGCDLFQGFLFSRPVDVQDFEEMLLPVRRSA